MSRPDKFKDLCDYKDKFVSDFDDQTENNVLRKTVDSMGNT